MASTLLEVPVKPLTVNSITILLILVLLITGIFYYTKIYTSITFISLAIILIYVKLILKPDWLGKFYLVYTVLLIPFLIINGILTGTGLKEPVVWYNPNEILGIRILTIPIEDVF